MSDDQLSMFRNTVPPQRSRAPRGRGSAFNPRNRVRRLHVEPLDTDTGKGDDGEGDDGEGIACEAVPGAEVRPAVDTDRARTHPRRLRAPARHVDTTFIDTTIIEDKSRSVIARNDSPDVGFEASVNPYRGCEHGCVYCYARPTHEFLGFSAGLDFESRILVKSDAPTLLRAELSRPGWKPQPLALSGATDPYQPVERRLRLTRGCLEVLSEFRHPVTVTTKSHLVTRDLDLLTPLAAHEAASVTISLTTLNAQLARTLEPRAPGPAQRLHAIHVLAQAGVPVGVMVAPVIPGLTDSEIPAILEAAAVAGASHAGYVVLRLPSAVQALFVDWLERCAPDRKEKVLGRLRALRGGALDDARFHARMRGEGPYAEQITDLFELGLRRAGLAARAPELSAAAFRPPAGQLPLF